ncbi:hypothetical protein QYM36_010574 [Artemia franciscana]|nr:hypothetical protein QYM36_010072 [Artemia franciscana]KAK2716042.1 hypothetical protein QYM36_010574 [Artemia franciscana]
MPSSFSEVAASIPPVALTPYSGPLVDTTVTDIKTTTKDNKGIIIGDGGPDLALVPYALKILFSVGLITIVTVVTVIVTVTTTNIFFLASVNIAPIFFPGAKNYKPRKKKKPKRPYPEIIYEGPYYDYDGHEEDEEKDEVGKLEKYEPKVVEKVYGKATRRMLKRETLVHN